MVVPQGPYTCGSLCLEGPHTFYHLLAYCSSVKMDFRCHVLQESLSDPDVVPVSGFLQHLGLFPRQSTHCPFPGLSLPLD